MELGSAARWWREVVAGDHVVQPRRIPHLEAVFSREGRDDVRVGGPVGRSLAHAPEEVLEAGWADHLDHAGRNLAGVPHSVGFTARLGYVPARAENDLPVPRPEPNLALGHDRVLVLLGVQV